MEPSAHERVGVLVIRVWLEDENPRFFRARVLSTSDVEREPERTESFANADDLLAGVSRWISGFARAGPAAADDPINGSDV